MSKQIKMTENQSAKVLDVILSIRTINVTPSVHVELSDGLKIVYDDDFKMLPNVPLESYVQYTFGEYNATICKNQSENA